MNSANFTQPILGSTRNGFLAANMMSLSVCLSLFIFFAFVADNVFWEMVIAFSVTEEGMIQASRGKIQGYS